jgi:hypothetical protein
MLVSLERDQCLPAFFMEHHIAAFGGKEIVMKSVCVFCQKLLRGDPADEDVSHGACKKCASDYLRVQLAIIEKLINERRGPGCGLRSR